MYGIERIQPLQFFVKCPREAGAQGSWDWPFMFFFTTDDVDVHSFPSTLPASTGVLSCVSHRGCYLARGNGLPPGNRTHHTGLLQDSAISHSSLGLGAATLGACFFHDLGG